MVSWSEFLQGIPFERLPEFYHSFLQSRGVNIPQGLRRVQQRAEAELHQLAKQGLAEHQQDGWYLQPEVLYFWRTLGMDKTALRAWAKRSRANLPVVDVTHHAAQWIRQRKAQHVLLYHAFGSEVSLQGLPHVLPEMDFYTTRTETQPQPHLTLHPYFSELETHPLGMQQPTLQSPRIAPEMLDMVFVPALAFDVYGNRLGYGKGFYDRLLSGLGCVTVGVAHKALVLPHIPHHTHDIPVQYLLTENGIQDCLSSLGLN